MLKKQIYTKEWIDIPWKNYLLGCCDCRLIHKIDFKVVGQKLKMRTKLCPKLTKEARQNL